MKRSSPYGQRRGQQNGKSDPYNYGHGFIVTVLPVRSVPTARYNVSADNIAVENGVVAVPLLILIEKRQMALSATKVLQICTLKQLTAFAQSTKAHL